MLGYGGVICGRCYKRLQWFTLSWKDDCGIRRCLSCHIKTWFD